MDKFSRLVLNWYALNARDLPWRNHPDPYAVWVSEIMLQQTQVGTVIPYFNRWMEKFPDIRTLAHADLDDVLSAWEGLGYYARARNMHKAAGTIMKSYGGKLPGDSRDLRKLPGIGRYTAAAIASIAFGADEATVDGNIRRVFARVFNLAIPMNTASGMNSVWEISSSHLPKGYAGDYNQALMDIGATVCFPRNPDCKACPVKGICLAKRLGKQNELPVVGKNPAIPTRVKAAVVIRRGGNVLMTKRASGGMLGGMWEFPSVIIAKKSVLGVPSAIKSDYQFNITVKSRLTTLRHTYSHFKLTEHVFLCTLKSRGKLPVGCRWIPLDELGDFPMGKVDRLIATFITDGNG